MFYKITRRSSDELCHYGISGQKWGVRRYENYDGTLTEEGKLRYLGNYNEQLDRYNRMTDSMNEKLETINKKWEKVLDRGITPDEDVQYTKEIVDTFIDEYSKVLVSDLAKKGITASVEQAKAWCQECQGVAQMNDELRRVEDEARRAKDPNKGEPSDKLKYAATLVHPSKEDTTWIKMSMSPDEVESDVKEWRNTIEDKFKCNLASLKIDGVSFSRMPIDQQWYVLFLMSRALED